MFAKTISLLGLDGKKRNQTVLERFLIFVCSGVLTFVLNAGSYKLFYFIMGWSHALSYGCSLTLMTVTFFFWNYYFNFRTNTHIQHSMWRYIGTMALMWCGNYAIVGAAHYFKIGVWWFNILGTQVLLSGIKFSLYHFWVFPHGDSKNT